jgi:hypothetical protein
VCSQQPRSSTWARTIGLGSSRSTNNWATPPRQSRCQVISCTGPAVGGFELGETPLADVTGSRVELGARDLEGGGEPVGNSAARA